MAARNTALVVAQSPGVQNHVEPGVTDEYAVEQDSRHNPILLAIGDIGGRPNGGDKRDLADDPGADPHILRGQNGECPVRFVDGGALEPSLFQKPFQLFITRIQNRTGTTRIKLEEDVSVS
jgi:hypothetical protein